MVNIRKQSPTLLFQWSNSHYTLSLRIRSLIFTSFSSIIINAVWYIKWYGWRPRAQWFYPQLDKLSSDTAKPDIGTWHLQYGSNGHPAVVIWTHTSYLVIPQLTLCKSRSWIATALHGGRQRQKTHWKCSDCRLHTSYLQKNWVQALTWSACYMRWTHLSGCLETSVFLIKQKASILFSGLCGRKA